MSDESLGGEAVLPTSPLAQSSDARQVLGPEVGLRRARRIAPGRSVSAAVTVALALVVLTYVWRVQDLFPVLGALQVPILSSLVALGWFASTYGGSRLKVLWRDPLMRSATLILALMVIGVPFSLYKGRSFSFIIDDHIRTFAMTAVLALGLRSYRDIERSFMAHVLGAALFGWLTYAVFEVGEEGRLGDLPYYDANDLGLLMVMVIPLVVHFLGKRPGASLISRLAMLPVLTLCVLAIVKSGSRGAFIGLVGMGLTLLLFYRVVPLFKRIVIVVAAVGLLVVFGGDSYWELMRTILNPTTDYNWSGASETGRMEIWKRGMGYMLSRPIFGVGVNCFPVAEGTLSANAAQQALGFGFKWSTAHNSFVQIGAELGIVGLSFFLLLLGRSFKTLWAVARLKPRGDRALRSRISLAQALLASMVGFILTGFFLSMAYGAVLYLFIGQIAALGQVMAQEQIQVKPRGRPRLRPV